MRGTSVATARKADEIDGRVICHKKDVPGAMENHGCQRASLCAWFSCVPESVPLHLNGLTN